MNQMTKTIKLSKIILLAAMAAILLFGAGMLSKADAAEDYGLYVSGVKVTSDNADDVLGDGTVGYDPTTRTLKLKNANFLMKKVEGEDNALFGICESGDFKGEDFTISLEGSNVISVPEKAESGIESAAGIEMYVKHLNIIGGGELTISSENKDIAAQQGIYQNKAGDKEMSMNIKNTDVFVDIESKKEVTGLRARKLNLDGAKVTILLKGRDVAGLFGMDTVLDNKSELLIGCAGSDGIRGMRSDVTVKGKSGLFSNAGNDSTKNESFGLNEVIFPPQEDPSKSGVADNIANKISVENGSEAVFVGRTKALKNASITDSTLKIGVKVNTEINDNTLLNARKWNGKDPLYGEETKFKYVAFRNYKDQTGLDTTPFGICASMEAANAAALKWKKDKDPKGTDFAPLKLKSTKQSKKSIKLTWKKNKYTAKYVIYGTRCGNKNALKKIATTKKGAYTVKKAGKKLKAKKYYKFMVVAINKYDNVVTSSKLIHVATKGSKKAANYTGMTLKAKIDKKGKKTKKYKNISKTTIKSGSKFKLKAVLKKAKKTKVKKYAAVRYESSDESIARVSSKGVVTGDQKGKCTIYAYTQNGISKTITIRCSIN